MLREQRKMFYSLIERGILDNTNNIQHLFQYLVNRESSSKGLEILYRLLSAAQTETDIISGMFF